MARVELPIVALNTTTGLPVAGASVLVKVRASGLNATWWTQETGGTSSTAAVTTDSAGRTNAWFDRGSYNAVISGTGITTYTEPWDAAPASDSAIDGLWLPDNVIITRHLADNAVSTAEINALAVTAAKIANDTITATQIAADAVGNSELAPSAVTDTEVAAGANILQSKLKKSSGVFTDSYSGTGFATARTIAHGLGVTPAAVIVQQNASNANLVAATAAVTSRDATNIVVVTCSVLSGVAPNWNVDFTWYAWA